ncbi:MAG TPA: tetratricopeptide repeat protein [Terracidiphilus sp.]
MTLMILSILMAAAQHLSAQQSDGLTIQGTVVSSAGKAVGDALVRLEQQSASATVEVKTNAAGSFTFSALIAGSYRVSAEKAGLRSELMNLVVSPHGDQQHVHLVLSEKRETSEKVHSDTSALAPSTTQDMEFADKPNFTIAGVTDWTAAGGHGSDSSLRTSEALVRATVTLKPEDEVHSAANSAVHGNEADGSENKLRETLAATPGSSDANHRLGEFYLHAGRYWEAIPLLETSYRIDPGNRGDGYDLAVALKRAGDFSQANDEVKKLLAHGETAELHRLAGELDEKLNDPLAAVHEYEQAVRMEPDEENYFEWGSELLIHRAVWQAQEVFQQGAKAYPKSERMLSALGAALFAGALYDEAALRFCDASDLNPADPEPYIFMGKIEMAAPSPLTCVEKKLARFVKLQPGNALANFYYAMALSKRQGGAGDERIVQQVELLLTKAITIDPKCSDAYLQLGILYSSRLEYQKAIAYYEKAIEANPQLSDAHYRLGVAYDRTGELEEAKKEFQIHDEIRKQQAALVQQQRREVKQFVVVLPGQPTSPIAH